MNNLGIQELEERRKKLFLFSMCVLLGGNGFIWWMLLSATLFKWSENFIVLIILMPLLFILTSAHKVIGFILALVATFLSWCAIAPICDGKGLLYTILFVLSNYIAGYIVNIWNTDIKEKVYRMILPYAYANDSITAVAKNDISAMKARLNIFSASDYCTVDDVFYGEYENFRFSFAENSMYYVVGSGKHKRTVYEFVGTTLILDLPIAFAGDILISNIRTAIGDDEESSLLDKIANFSFGQKKQNTAINLLEINSAIDYTRVLTNNVDEANVLLDAKIVSNLNEYYKSRVNLDIQGFLIVVSGSKLYFLNQNVNNTNIDRFEFPIYKSLLPLVARNEALEEINNALKIIDILELKNLGSQS